MTQNDINSIKSKILEAIKEGEVVMRPRWHFVLRSVLMVLGAVLVLLGIMYIVSFIIFALHESGIWFTPVFGGRGWFSFFRSLPWLLIVLSLLFIGVLEVLVRRFSFGYRQPLLYSALGIICVTTFGSVIIAQTSFHRYLFRAAQNGNLPYVGDFYRGFGSPEIPDIHVGVIHDLSDQGFTLMSRHGSQYQVIINATTSFPLGTDFAEGDMVIVIGEGENRVIEALGIRKADDSMDFPPNMPPPGVRHGTRIQFVQ
jgi:ABC-type multidrug transport system fused ATPase/permease subunit